MTYLCCWCQLLSGQFMSEFILVMDDSVTLWPQWWLITWCKLDRHCTTVLVAADKYLHNSDPGWHITSPWSLNSQKYLHISALLVLTDWEVSVVSIWKECLWYAKSLMYRQVSNIRGTKSQHLKDSHTVLQLSLPNLLKPDVKSRMKM